MRQKMVSLHRVIYCVILGISLLSSVMLMIMSAVWVRSEFVYDCYWSRSVDSASRRYGSPVIALDRGHVELVLRTGGTNARAVAVRWHRQDSTSYIHNPHGSLDSDPWFSFNSQHDSPGPDQQSEYRLEFRLVLATAVMACFACPLLQWVWCLHRARCRLSQGLLVFGICFFAPTTHVGAQLLTTRPAVEHDSLADDLAALKRQSVQQVGRDSVVEAYKRFIAKAGNDPRAAEAMLAIGSMYESIAQPDMHVEQDPKTALEWFQKAAAVAPIGSPSWREASFHIAGMMRWSDPAGARELYLRIQQSSPNNLLVEVEVDHAIMGTYAGTDILKSEEYARRILDWYDVPDHMPTDPWEKRQIDLLLGSASSCLCDQWEVARVPSADRISRLRKLQKDYPAFMFLQKDTDRAIQAVEKRVASDIDPILTDRLQRMDAPRAVPTSGPGVRKD